MVFFSKRIWGYVLGVVVATSGCVAHAADGESIIKDGRIGYMISDTGWANYRSADSADAGPCPRGTSPYGPREVFKALYPKLGSVENTELAREALRVFPEDAPAQFEYIEVSSNTAIGFNLDGKVGLKDFTSPEGEKGIDNAFYRVTGCQEYIRDRKTNVKGRSQILIELANVDNLANDPDVTVNIFRSLDPVLLDANSQPASGGTQRIDVKYGQRFIQHLHGKVVDGVLTTDPKDGTWLYPRNSLDLAPRLVAFHDMRLRLKVTPQSAEGMLGGYADIQQVFKGVTDMDTHHLSYGQLDAPEFYWELRKNADAYPDPKDGRMTAISSAITMKLVQVFIEHPADQIALGTSSDGARISQAGTALK